jgi:2-dehydropantoate 2-reductase
MIAVLGPGGVGGFLAAALTRAGEEVIVVAREATPQAGIEVQSRLLGDFAVTPPVTTRLTDPPDVLFVCTKATTLEPALDRIVIQPGLVIPLLNGVEHMAALRQRFDRVLAAVIRIDSDRPEPGRIVQKSPGARIDLAGQPPAVAGALARAGFEVRTGDSEPRVLWSKLTRLNALALTTSAADRPLGFIREDPRWRSALEGAVRETAAAANAEGAALDPADTLAELDQAHADLGSSMQRDIAAGRAPELDAIAGAVIRAADRHTLDHPVTTWLHDRVAARIKNSPRDSACAAGERWIKRGKVAGGDA